MLFYDGKIKDVVSFVVYNW